MAEQHLTALECLIENDLTGIGLGPSARSVAEASGRAGWLLDHTLATNRRDARRRVARYLMDHEENQRLFKRLSYEFKHPDRASSGERARRAKETIRKPGLFYPSEIVPAKRTGRLTLCGETLPGPSGFVRYAGKIFGDDPRSTSGVYGYMSAMTHPTIFALAESLTPLSQLEPDSNEFPYKRDSEFTLKVAGNAVRAFHNCWRLWIAWTDTGMEEARTVSDAHHSALAIGPDPAP